MSAFLPTKNGRKMTFDYNAPPTIPGYKFFTVQSGSTVDARTGRRVLFAFFIYHNLLTHRFAIVCDEGLRGIVDQLRSEGRFTHMEMLS